MQIPCVYIPGPAPAVSVANSYIVMEIERLRGKNKNLAVPLGNPGISGSANSEPACTDSRGLLRSKKTWPTVKYIVYYSAKCGLCYKHNFNMFGKARLLKVRLYEILYLWFFH